MHVKSSGGAQITVTLTCEHPAYVVGGELRKFATGDTIGTPVTPDSTSTSVYTWTIPGGVKFYKVDANARALDKNSQGKEKVWFKVLAEQGGATMPIANGSDTPNPERKLGRNVIGTKNGATVGTPRKYRDFIVNVM